MLLAVSELQKRATRLVKREENGYVNQVLFNGTTGYFLTESAFLFSLNC